MIRFSQLCALILRCRGVKDTQAAVCFGTFGPYQQCNRQATNHRQYATAPQGNNAVCIFVVLHFRCNFFFKVQTLRLRADEDSINAGTVHICIHTLYITYIKHLISVFHM
jgi:hypothetical protein